MMVPGGARACTSDRMVDLVGGPGTQTTPRGGVLIAICGLSVFMGRYESLWVFRYGAVLRGPTGCHGARYASASSADEVT
ncbi:hypothetical protein Slala05_09540 [Streptomyces lavendulae subsp. lavendulae]|nr:hypothetical protein Slala05_09540 [Streptomyces lavendulae subsp. lavendulae]